MPDRPRGRNIILPLGLSLGLVVSLVTVVDIVRLGVGQSLAETSPKTAIAWDPGNRDALLRQAQQDLQRGEVEASRSLARRALQADPTSGPALRILSLAASQQGDGAGAIRLMELSHRLSRRDPLTQSWLFERKQLRGDYAAAYLHADALIRRSPTAGASVMAAMAGPLEQPAARAAVVTRLLTQPPWRAAFLRVASQTNPDSAFLTLEGIRAAGGAVKPHEIEDYADAMVTVGRFREARERSLQLLGRGAGGQPIFDGHFTGTTGVAPFAWDLGEGEGVTTSFGIANGALDGKVLRIDYDGYSTPRLPRQLVVLAPGFYALTGREFAEIGSAERLSWELTCVGASEPIAKTPAAESARKWRSFTVRFEVPKTGCDAQWLSLRARIGDRSDSVVVLYDLLGVVAATAPGDES